jgi:hypothetical protein
MRSCAPNLKQQIEENHHGLRTLGQLASEKMALVAVCRRCQHRKALYMPCLIERFGEQMPVIDVRKHLRRNNYL